MPSNLTIRLGLKNFSDSERAPRKRIGSESKLIQPIRSILPSMRSLFRLAKKRIAQRLLAAPHWWPLLRKWQRWRHFRNVQEKPYKVFCVGYFKTATTSVGHALKMLGYRHASFQLDLHVSKDEALIMQEMGHYDSFDDLPWMRENIIKLAIEKYPHARFILTTRNPDRWLQSMQRYFGTTYDDPIEEKRRFTERNDRVRSMLSKAGCDFIEVDIATDLKWEVICPFLGHEIPDAPFPRVNTIEQHENRWNWV